MTSEDKGHRIAFKVISYLEGLGSLKNQPIIKDDQLRKHTVTGIMEGIGIRRSSIYPAMVCLLDKGLIVKEGKVLYGVRTVEYFNITAQGTRAAAHIQALKEVGLL